MTPVRGKRHLSAVGPHRIAVLALAPVVGFDLTIPPTVFGAATQADGTPLYDVRICGLEIAPIRASAGFSLIPDYGPEALADADTVIIPGTYIAQPRYEGTLPDDLADGARDHPAGHPDRVDLHRRVRPRRGRAARRSARDHALAAGRAVPQRLPAGAARRGPAVHRRRRHPHVGRPRGGRGPLPPSDPPRLRQRGGEPGRAALRRTAVAGRWSVTVHRARRTGGRQRRHRADPRVGARAARPRRSACRRWPLMRR